MFLCGITNHCSVAAWPVKRRRTSQPHCLGLKLWLSDAASALLSVYSTKKVALRKPKFQAIARKKQLRVGCKQSSCVRLIRKWQTPLTCLPAVAILNVFYDHSNANANPTFTHYFVSGLFQTRRVDIFMTYFLTISATSSQFALCLHRSQPVGLF